MHRVLIVAGVILVAVQCLKFVGVLSAIRWIVVRGGSFMAELRGRGDDFSEADYWELLDRTGGRSVLPLGVLEYRLLRFAGRRSRVVGTALRAIRVLIYDFTALGLLVAGYLFLAGTPRLAGESGGAVAGLAWAAAGLAAVQLVAIFAEASVSYARLGSYGLGWHGASRYVENRRAGTYFAEAKVLVGAVVYALVIGAFVFYFSAGHGADYNNLTVAGTTPGAIVADVLTCLYYALVTFFTADTPGPVNGPARLATVILVVQAACALIIAATTAALFLRPDPVPDEVAVAVVPASPASGRDAPAAGARRVRSGSRPGFVAGVVMGAALVTAVRASRKRRRRAGR